MNELDYPACQTDQTLPLRLWDLKNPGWYILFKLSKNTLFEEDLAGIFVDVTITLGICTVYLEFIYNISNGK
jgi:hypothetical protein